jgi:negative elongation factor E
LQKKQVQALKTKPEPEKPLIPKRPKDARDAREVARKLIKAGNINISKPESGPVQFKRPKGQERKKVAPEPTTYHPFSTSSSIEDDSSSSKSPLPTPEKVDG